MSLPGLHISLGLYLKFFRMLEDECYQLDLEIATMMAERSTEYNQNQNFQSYIASCKSILVLEKSIEKSKNELEFLNDSILVQILHNPQNEDFIKSIYQPRIDELDQQLSHQVHIFFVKYK